MAKVKDCTESLLLLLLTSGQVSRCWGTGWELQGDSWGKTCGVGTGAAGRVEIILFCSPWVLVLRQPVWGGGVAALAWLCCRPAEWGRVFERLLEWCFQVAWHLIHKAVGRGQQAHLWLLPPSYIWSVIGALVCGLSASLSCFQVKFSVLPQRCPLYVWRGPAAEKSGRHSIQAESQRTRELPSL